jgi:hypothetical protein
MGLKAKAETISKTRNHTWYVLFSKTGFTPAVLEEATATDNILLVSLDDIMNA